jgi:tight adherence protein C
MQNLIQIGLLVALFTAVCAFVVWAAERVQAVFVVHRRLSGERRVTTEATSLIKRKTVTNPLFAWVQKSTSLSDEADRTRLVKLLRKAGIEHPSAPFLYVIARIGLAIGLPLLFLLSQTISDKPTTGNSLIIVALVLCAVGFIAPNGIVERLARLRGERLEHEFPDALDLMVVCVEAGLGMEAAFVRVGDEVQKSHRLIAHQFDLVSQELRAGRSRTESLRNFAERTDVPAIRSFTALMIQTDSLGGSIAQTLRTYSEEMRETRLLKAEEKALRIPVLLTIPLVGCMLPVIVGAVMLPAGIEIGTSLIPALTGGAR